MPEPSESAATPRDRAIRALWNTDASEGRRQSFLFAVLDAAQDARIYRELRRLGSRETIVPLYQDAAATEFAAVAPYLVQFGNDMRLFNWIFSDGWARSWGIFLWSTRTVDGLRAHLRTLTRIRTESGETRLFRFYDPRVLASVLPILDPDQLRSFFGPLQRISVEASAGRALETYEIKNGILSKTRSNLS